MTSQICDLRERKIPNRLTVPFIVIGLGFHLITDFPNGIAFSLIGTVIGFLIFLVPYMMKAMGAGDIKLMTALGALTGDRTVIYIALFTAIAGGCIVFSYRIYKGGLLRTLNRTKDLLIYYLFFVLEKFSGLPTMTLRKEKYRVDLSDKKRDYIPYALAIGSGVLVTMALSQLGVIVGLSI